MGLVVRKSAIRGFDMVRLSYGDWLKDLSLHVSSLPVKFFKITNKECADQTRQAGLCLCCLQVKKSDLLTSDARKPDFLGGPNARKPDFVACEQQM